MYYVDEEQIGARLRFIPLLSQALRRLALSGDPSDVLSHFAQERALHLAIESVTDVGSLLIDGFMMRDAGSYEDIIDVLHTEGVLADDAAARLKSLASLRRPLIQQYMNLDRSKLRDDLAETAQLLEQFPAIVSEFLDKEKRKFSQR